MLIVEHIGHVRNHIDSILMLRNAGKKGNMVKERQTPVHEWEILRILAKRETVQALARFLLERGIIARDSVVNGRCGIVSAERRG